jgi:hypothetical protein
LGYLGALAACGGYIYFMTVTSELANEGKFVRGVKKGLFGLYRDSSDS